VPRTADRRRHLGEQIAVDLFRPRSHGRQPLQTGRIIHPGSPECPARWLGINSANDSSGAWAAANDPFATPFLVTEAALVTSLGVCNGSAAGDSVDIGVYDRSWNRIVSTGSQTPSTASGFDFFDVTDTALAPGMYYCVVARSAITANRQLFFGHTADARLCRFAGCYDSTTDAFPLPNPLTNMVPAATFTRVPFWAVVFRTPFA
jgi:hypothetical protein